MAIMHLRGMYVINLTNQNQTPVKGDRVRVEYAGGTYAEFYYQPPDDTPKTFLHMTFPESVTVGQTINMTAAVKLGNGTLAPVNSVYNVPIIRESDGLQVDYLEITFEDGEAAFSFVPDKPGKLIMVTSKIHPIPTAIVVNVPEIIVKKA